MYDSDAMRGPTREFKFDRLISRDRLGAITCGPLSSYVRYVTISNYNSNTKHQKPFPSTFRMGLSLSSLLGSLSSLINLNKDKDVRILMLGLDSAGKVSGILAMVQDRVSSTGRLCLADHNLVQVTGNHTSNFVQFSPLIWLYLEDWRSRLDNTK
jgi:hypothetical protein